jgi:hypothetical protein
MFEGNEFWLADTLDRRSLIRVHDERHGRISLRPKSLPGTYKRDWNASVTDRLI